MTEEYISLSSKVFNIVYTQYCDIKTSLVDLIRQHKGAELNVKNEYSGRELLEMVQNVDDQHSPKARIELKNNDRLLISNWGDRPFSEPGLKSILFSFNSPKDRGNIETTRPIGCKGLGFRSLLNWSEDITIHSNGVACRFANDIARKSWFELKPIILANGSITQDEINQLEEKYDIPLAILTMPDVQASKMVRTLGQESTSPITSIELQCSSTAVSDKISNSIKTFKPETLLFLNHINEIELVQDTIRTIQIDKSDAKYPSIYDSENPNTNLRYTLNCVRDEINGRPAEATAAFSPMLGNENQIYSFFPTKHTLHSRCVLHATFDLSSNRETINNVEENLKVWTLAAEAVIGLVRRLIENSEKEPKWEAYDVLDISDEDIKNYPIFAETIKKQIPNLKIIPCVDGKYHTMDDCYFYSDNFAKWLSDHPDILPEYFYHHAIKKDGGISKINSIMNLKEHFKEPAEELYRQIPASLDLELRADIIVLLADYYREYKGVNMRGNNVECYLKFKMPLLITSEEKLFEPTACDNTIYNIATGNENLPPDFLNLTYLNIDLVKILQRKWGKKDVREVSTELESFVATKIIDTDVAPIKDRLATWSRNEEITEQKLIEILKWLKRLTENKTDSYANEVNKNFKINFHFLAKDGHKYPVASLIISETKYDFTVSDRYRPIFGISKLKELLGFEDINKCNQFLLNTVGMSEFIPRQWVTFSNDTDFLNKNAPAIEQNLANANDFSNSRVGKISEQIKNQCYVAINDFFPSSSEFIPEALRLLYKDRHIQEAFAYKQACYFKRNFIDTSTHISYAAWSLRKSSLLSELSSKTIKEIWNKVVTPNINHSVLQRMLLDLGVHLQTSDLSLIELFRKVAQIQEAKGVAKKYQYFRKEILKKAHYTSASDAEIIAARTGILKEVFASYQGKVQLMPVENVYYWDNNPLPASLLQEIPCLEIGKRIGEESVTRIFGVKSSSSLSVTVINSVIDEEKTKQFREFLALRLPCLCAYRIASLGDSSPEDNVRRFKNFVSNVWIVKSLEYSYLGNLLQLDDNEFIPRGDAFYFKCSTFMLDDIFNNPSVLNIMVEALSIKLKVTGDIAKYRSVLMCPSISMAEGIILEDVGYETLTEAKRLLGIDIKEEKFWRVLFQMEEKDFLIIPSNPSERSQFFNKHFHSFPFKDSFPEIDTLTIEQSFELGRWLFINFRDVYSEALKNAQINLFGNYYQEIALDAMRLAVNEAYLKEYAECSEKIKSNSKLTRKYIQEFIQATDRDENDAMDKANSFVEKNLYTYLSDPKEEIDKIFGNLSTSKELPKTLPKYNEILKKSGILVDQLNDELRRMMLFDNCEEIFQECLDQLKKEEIEISDYLPYPENIPLTFGSFENNNNVELQKSTIGHIHSGFTSEARKSVSGNRAEDLVYKKLLSLPEQFADVTAISRNSNPANGHDEKHYDFTYRRCVEGQILMQTHYLDVKSMSGDTIYFSAAEYWFAKEHAGSYDLAIVHNDKIIIWETPFDSNTSSPIKISPHTYSARLLHISEKEAFSSAKSL